MTYICPGVSKNIYNNDLTIFHAIDLIQENSDDTAGHILKGKNEIVDTSPLNECKKKIVEYW